MLARRCPVVLQALQKVVNVPVARHALVVAVGIETYVLVSNPKANIVRLIPKGALHQQLAVQRLGSSQVFDVVDYCSNTVIHEDIDLLVASVGFYRYLRSSSSKKALEMSRKSDSFSLISSPT